MFVAHINMGLATAAMGLLWMITVEAYPKKYRYMSIRSDFIFENYTRHVPVIWKIIVKN